MNLKISPVPTPEPNPAPGPIDVNNPYQSVNPTHAQLTGNAPALNFQRNCPIPGPDQTVYYTPAPAPNQNGPFDLLRRMGAGDVDELTQF